MVLAIASAVTRFLGELALVGRPRPSGRAGGPMAADGRRLAPGELVYHTRRPEWGTARVDRFTMDRGVTFAAMDGFPGATQSRYQRRILPHMLAHVDPR